MYIRMDVCMYCMYVCMYVRMYVCTYAGIDPEINQGGGWFRFILGLTIIAKFKDTGWGVW